jgi:hypothetical protein
MFIASATVPKDLGHVLHRAAVRGGELSVRVDRADLDRLIMAAANQSSPDKRAERKLEALLRYLETMSDRFEEPEEGNEYEAAGNESSAG